MPRVAETGPQTLIGRRCNTEEMLEHTQRESPEDIHITSALATNLQDAVHETCVAQILQAHAARHGRQPYQSRGL